MGSRFLGSFLLALTLTLAALGGVGWAVTRLVVATPREPFLTGAFQFDLAPGWRCELDGTEYVCNPPGKPPHAAIVIMAMKERGKDDRLEAYEEHLRRPKPVERADGSTAMSEVRRVGRIRLGGKEWVEALHVGSELPNFLTYYLATTTSHLGILVTMSTHRDHAATYVAQLNEMMASLSAYQR